MTNINNIQIHINKCTNLMKSNNIEEISDFITELVAVYGTEIENFTAYLNSYIIVRMDSKLTLVEAKKDLNIIRAQLENYRENIKSGLNRKKDYSSININNLSNATSIANVNASFEQIINNVNELSSNNLSEEEKEELENLLRILESTINGGNKEKIESKLKKVFEYALKKGPTVIALVSNVVSLLSDKIIPLFSK